MLYNSGNEANKNYHLWSALSALSSIISRRVWINMGYFRIYPNLYVILCGPPGNKKTTAMSVAKTLIRHLLDIPFSGECQTKESLVLELSTCNRTFDFPNTLKPYTYTPISIFVTELSQFIGVDPARMIDFLTTVYDQDFYDLKTKNKGCQLIVGPYVTMLACTTPEWITNYLKSDVITGGFSRRALFVLEYDDSTVRIAFPEITPEMQKAWDGLLTYAHELFTKGGEFQWEPSAKEWYIKWYTTRIISADPLIRWFDATSYVQALKIGMLLSLSESTDMIMRQRHLEQAFALLEVMKVNLPKVFQGIGRNELNVVKMKVLSVLTTTGPLKENKLMAMIYSELPHGGMDFDTLMRDMDKCGDIKRVQKLMDKEPRPTYICTMQQFLELKGSFAGGQKDVPPSAPLPDGKVMGS